MNEKPDPRVFFAAERTLLAWLRTGIASIGLGFLVARFGYFLLMMNGRTPTTSHSAPLIGIGLVLLGTFIIASSAWQHSQFLKSLPPHDLPPRYSTRLSLVLAVLMVFGGIALTVYLATAIDTREKQGSSSPAGSVHRLRPPESRALRTFDDEPEA